MKRIRLDMVDEDVRDRDEHNLQDEDDPPNDPIDPFNALLNQSFNADTNIVSQPQQQQNQEIVSSFFFKCCIVHI